MGVLPVQQCFYSQETTFLGECPIKRCPANVGTLHSSGCAHILFPRERLGFLELSYITGADRHEIEERYYEELDELQRILELLNLLDSVPDNTGYNHCSKCGIIVSFGDCLNQDNCRFRKRTLNRTLKRLFSNLPDERPNIQLSHLWALLADQSCTVGHLTELLALSKKKARRLFERTTLVPTHNRSIP